MYDMRGGLIALFQNSDCKHWFRDNADIKEFADYLIASGVILPPCKVGDTVYGFFSPRRDIVVVSEEKVTGIGIDTDDECYLLNDFGKTVFLTKEEAERLSEDSF